MPDNTKPIKAEEVRASISALEGFLALPATQQLLASYLADQGLSPEAIGYHLEFSKIALDAFNKNTIFELNEPAIKTSDLTFGRSSNNTKDFAADFVSQQANEETLASLKANFEMLAGEIDVDAWLTKNQEETEKAMALMVSFISYHSDLKKSLNTLFTDFLKLNEDKNLTDSERAALRTGLENEIHSVLQQSADLDMLVQEFNKFFNQTLGTKDFIYAYFIELFKAHVKNNEA